MKKRILICEDEKNIVAFLTAELAHEGYETNAVYDGESALALFAQEQYDLILLDLMLPVKNGFEVLQAVRKTSDVPVIVLTARKETFDKVLLLKSGADDYVTKPFDTMELLARIERNIRRNQNNQSLTARDLTVDYDGFSAHIDGNTLFLTKTEFEILYCLLQNAGKVINREQILGRLYGSFLGDSNVIDVNIKNIRKKIALHTEQPYIETVRGKGYVIRI